jgi:threonine aldolase
MGTVYSPAEIKAIADLAHSRGMFLHVDGARIANAVAYLDIEPAALLCDTGVDVLSFGGTKNGMLFGEAVIFFTSPRKGVQYLRKQLMQLHSKGRFIAAQFSAVLDENLWIRAAARANSMARLLAEKADEKGIQITQPVQGNEVFAIIPKDRIEKLQNKSFFYVWDENKSEVRWVCSFDTDESDVLDFINNFV